MQIVNKIKSLINTENELLIIGLTSILIAIWTILYLIPNIFANLFNTILGKIILILICILVGFYNLNYGLIFLLIIIIIYRFISISKSKIKEGFTWNPSSTDNFLNIQKLINPKIVFDVQEIQKQVPQEEVDYFIKNGKWNWSEKTKELYKKSLDNNPYVRTEPEDAINTASTIYNENAILQMLSWQTKEGQFLLNGVSIHGGKTNPYEALPNGWGDYAFNSKQITKNNKVIKCEYDKNKKSGLSLHEIENMGNERILNTHVKRDTEIDYKDLEKIIPGFTFLKEPCNPCEALENPPNYNCPFQLDIRGNKKGVSDVWKYLWNL